MTESRESGIEQPAVATQRRAVESPSPYGDGDNRPNSILVWVGIVVGVVFIAAVIFFAAFFIGWNSSGNFRGGYHQPGMLGPNQSGPYGQMWPGMTGPGSRMGPSGQWPDQQAPTTAVPNAPRAIGPLEVGPPWLG